MVQVLHLGSEVRLRCKTTRRDSVGRWLTLPELALGCRTYSRVQGLRV